MGATASPFRRRFFAEVRAVPVTCVIGLQWGDEAKGKLVDLLTDEHEIVVRYQGGSNAGHTVVTGGQTYKLSLIPSGILTPGVQCVVTGGVVLNPASILQEIDGLTARGVKVGKNLMISDRAHVIFPWHIAEDRALDKSCSSGENIGTTMRGIGPCYRDKVGRSYAVRLGDMYRDDFRQRIEHIVEAKNRSLASLNGQAGHTPLDADKQSAPNIAAMPSGCKPYVADTTAYLLDAVEAGQRLLFEGAQGRCWTSTTARSRSSPAATARASAFRAARACRAAGSRRSSAWSRPIRPASAAGRFRPSRTTTIGQHIRDRGNEYGTVTRRPRRCGWFDAVAARYTARLSGVDTLAVMLLDVLERTDGDQDLHGLRDRRPAGDAVSQPCGRSAAARARCLKRCPAGSRTSTGVRRMDDLPPAARDYLARLSQLIGRPVEVVSVGPDREQTIFAPDSKLAPVVRREQRRLQRLERQLPVASLSTSKPCTTCRSR